MARPRNIMWLRRRNRRLCSWTGGRMNEKSRNQMSKRQYTVLRFSNKTQTPFVCISRQLFCSERSYESGGGGSGGTDNTEVVRKWGQKRIFEKCCSC